MSTEKALLEDVLAHPEDDTPRLVLSDWWEEYGDESHRARAELIRVQVELARLPDEDPRRMALNARQNQLVWQRGSEWLASLPALDGVTWADEFQRGFVEQAVLDSPGAFLCHGPNLFAAAPVRAVRILGVAEGIFDLLAQGAPLLERLQELDLGGSMLHPSDLRFLADSPSLANLTTLLLHNTLMGDAGAEVLASAQHLRALQELYLSGNRIGNTGVLSLTTAARFPALLLLDLRDNHVGSAGLRFLAESPQMAGLESLFLVNNVIRAPGVRSLGGRLPNLTTLWLGHNNIGDQGIASLADDPGRAVLRNLDLQSCRLGDTAGQALARSPHLAGLDYLWLNGNTFSVDTLAVLRDRFGSRLRS